jgi:hypothetical protein
MVMALAHNVAAIGPALLVIPAQMAMAAPIAMPNVPAVLLINVTAMVPALPVKM